MDKHILAITRILYNFLKANGGMSNGYVTYISGSVQRSTHSRLNWNTPDKMDITGREGEERGMQLHDSVRKYLEDNNLENTLIITSKHLEWGCYETKLYFDTPTITLDLYGL